MTLPGPGGRPVPEGRLLQSRVVEDARAPLAEALDRALTGYVVLEPQEALLLDEAGRGVITFREGVPALAYHTATERGGPAALADLAAPGPAHVELYAFEDGTPDALADAPELRVPPGMPAERLAGDPALAASTRRAAPGDGTGPSASGTTAGEESGAGDDADGSGPDGSAQAPGDRSAVEAFLEDEDKIAAIKEQARAEARARAEAWDLPTEGE